MIEALTDKFLGRRIECECGTVHDVPSIDITIGAGAIWEIPETVRRLGLGKRAVLTADTRTFEAAGNAVLDELSKAAITTGLFVVEGECPEADIPRAETVLSAAEGSDFLVACGSGTINDLVKYASSRLDIPYVCVPTAPSMNGYTSSLVAILAEGLKTTVDGKTPAAIVADTNVLANCPHRMVLAGLGDLLSKNVSGADWWLSHHLRGDYFCELPLKMVGETVPWAQQAARHLHAGDEEQIEQLIEHLFVSGLSMTVAGMSRPSSGGEHLISHVWDMRNLSAGRDLELHGIQVAVATVMMARLYGEITAIDEIDRQQARASYRNVETVRRGVYDYHGDLARVMWNDFKPKLPSAERLEVIAEGWSTIRERLRHYAAPASQLEAILRAAGAPVNPGELGMDAGEIHDSVFHAREIRSRYTVLDLAADIGILEDFAAGLA